MKIKKILLCAFLFSNSIFAKENKIYIKGIDSNPSVPTSVSKKIENLLILSVIRVYPDSSVLSDDASISILKHGKISQSIGAETDFLNYLANSLQFQELITSNLQINGSTLQLSLQSVELTKSNNQLTIKNKVFLEFSEWEISYLIPEMVKALKDNNYTVARIPLNPQSGFKLAELSIPMTNGATLEPMQFESSDGLPTSFLEGVSEYTRKADAIYKKRKYFEASEEYFKILNSITTLHESTEKKVKQLVVSIQNRILLSNTAGYTELLQSRDKIIPKTFQNVSDEKLWNYFLTYLEDWKKYRSLPDYAKTSALDTAFRERAEGVMKSYLTRIESSGDENYQSLQFNTALVKYNSIESIWNPHSSLLELSSYQKQITSKIHLTMKSGTSYISSRAKGYLQFAESENSRAILENSMQNKASLKERKELAFQFMNQAKTLIETNPEFLEKGLISRYNSQAEDINTDTERHTFISPINIALAPVRYIGNILRGITDIFVFKFGYGIGVGGEVLVVGGNVVIASKMLVETSTAYGIQTERKKASSLNRLVYTNFLLSKQNDAETGLGWYSGYVLNAGNCISFGGRLCLEDGTNELSYKKYTTANVIVGLGPSVYIGLEFHRIPELFGILFFQDWDLLDQKSITRPRYKYFGLERVDLIEQK